MSTTCRRFALDQTAVLSPDVRAWLAEVHWVQHVSDLVDGLDRTTFYFSKEGDGRCNGRHEPWMIV